MSKFALVVLAVLTFSNVALSTPVEDKTAKEDTPKVKHVSVTVDKGAIYIDHDEEHVYTAPLDAEVYVQNGKIYVNNQLAYDYDTNTTYIPSHTPTEEERKSCAQPFTIYLWNGNIFNGDNSFATRVWRKKKYSWKNGKIYSQGKLAYDTCTKERHMPSYNGPDFPVDENLIKIKDGKVVEGKNDNIYVDGVLVDEDDTGLSQERIRFDVGGIDDEIKTLYVNATPVLMENPQDSRYEFPSHFEKRLWGKSFKLTVKGDKINFITNNMTEEEPVFQ